MNKIRTSERLSGLLAFALSSLFYIAVIALVLFRMRSRLAPQSAFNPAPVTLSFAQIELQAAAESPPEIKPEPSPPEEAEVAIEPKPEPPPPKPVKADAQVTQEASAPMEPSVDRNVLLDWVREQIEKEKYYPPAARNAGFEGQFQLLIKIGTDGKISEAAVLEGNGHPMLRRSLEKIMTGLIGRGFGQTLPDPVELPFDFEFRLN
ncbi:MAG: TonB family protein [Kiritimatiellales bacterium]